MGRPAEGFRQAEAVVVSGPRGAPRQLEIEWVRAQRGRLIFKFRGVDSVSQAEELLPAEVRIPLAERRQLPAGEHYQSDLVGCRVVERSTGRPLGIVTGWREFGAAPLLEVDTGAPGEPLLVPFARSICVEIDRDARRIVVELPEGLKELNG